MAYTTPNAAQVPGDIITSAIWNALQNNILYLKGAAGTIAFDAGATFSGVVTATAGIVATTISASGLIKTAGGIVSAGVISGADWLDLTGDTPHILIHSSGSGRLRFVVGGLSYGQLAADASDTFLDFGGANKRLIIRSEVEGTNVIYMQSGGISFVGAQTVDGVDVSALNTAYSGHAGGTAKAQHTGGTGLVFTELDSTAKEVSSTGAYEDWDINAIIPTGTLWVYIKCSNVTAADTFALGVRTNGSSLTRDYITAPGTSFVLPVVADANRIIDIASFADGTNHAQFVVVGYVA
jgi:hypothetical protein